MACGSWRGAAVAVVAAGLMAAATAGTAAAAADCSAHPPQNGGQVPTAMQGKWKGPFASQGYTGSVKLTMSPTSYVMDATVVSGPVTLAVQLPQCGITINVSAASGGDPNSVGTHMNMSTYYVGTGVVPNRTPDGCLSFVLVNETGVVQLRSAETLVEASPGMFRSECLQYVPATSSGNISVTTYVRSAASAPALAPATLLAASLAAALLVFARSRPD